MPEFTSDMDISMALDTLMYSDALVKMNKS